MTMTAFRRTAMRRNNRQKSHTVTFPAPVRGWVENENLSKSPGQSALILENWFPTQNGIRLRGGSLKVATIGSSGVVSLFGYKTASVSKLFATDDNNIYDISGLDADTAPAASVTGQTSGYYSTAQMGTAGGSFLYAVNGDDLPQLYNGTSWSEIRSTDVYDLPYDAETGNFTVGLTVTGGTSGATAVILSITDNGTDGTLRVDTLNGTFADNETITDTSTGSAAANIPSGLTTVQAINLGGIGDPADISHVWVYKSRLYFIEGGTLSAWYLPVDSVGGTLSEIALAGVFERGGKLLFGGTWSLDSGDGIDDKIVFVTDQGEVAIYEGSNPGDANTWALVGRYDITKPLGQNATMKAGGDLLIATEDGIVPITQVIQKDPSALSLAAVTRPIEPTWRAEARDRGATPYEMLKWPAENMGLVTLPHTGSSLYVVNLQTGAWAHYTGLDAQCLGLFGDAAYFGDSSGDIYQLEATGQDNAEIYVSRCCFAFDHLKTVSAIKQVKLARAIFLTSVPFAAKLSVALDYQIKFPAAPDVEIESLPNLGGVTYLWDIKSLVADGWDVEWAEDSIPVGSEAGADDSSDWDTAVWDESVWSEADEGGIDVIDPRDRETVYTRWRSIGRQGYAVAPQIQISSGSARRPDAELVVFDLVFETGNVVV